MFRAILYGKMLYETLRAYFAVNASGDLSILYKFCYSCLYILQPAFDSYDTFRIKKQIIASCKWQIGQLTNVLNYFYDNLLNRIYITQSAVSEITAPTFSYTTALFAPNFDGTTTVFVPEFSGQSSRTNVTIMVPSTVDLVDLKATVEQIKINGVPYSIATF